MAPEEKPTSKFVFTDEDDRPVVVASGSVNVRQGDKVWLLRSDGSREGPFYVAEVLSSTKCKLSERSGDQVGNDEEIDMAMLELA
ncbi:hypothetical protein F4780DRAFT_125751 [Xylariomycetidae sp. FL0641]|nr:hypothetical protein F4780DRAFT_125751 [Xylariomycetidae sp. FL0641]